MERGKERERREGELRFSSAFLRALRRSSAFFFSWRLCFCSLFSRAEKAFSSLFQESPAPFSFSGPFALSVPFSSLSFFLMRLQTVEVLFPFLFFVSLQSSRRRASCLLWLCPLTPSLPLIPSLVFALVTPPPLEAIAGAEGTGGRGTKELRASVLVECNWSIWSFLPLHDPNPPPSLTALFTSLSAKEVSNSGGVLCSAVAVWIRSIAFSDAALRGDISARGDDDRTFTARRGDSTGSEESATSAHIPLLS